MPTAKSGKGRTMVPWARSMLSVLVVTLALVGQASAGGEGLPDQPRSDQPESAAVASPSGEAAEEEDARAKYEREKRRSDRVERRSDDEDVIDSL